MNIVLTTYLTGKPDPQRNITWKPNDKNVVAVWIKSLTRRGLRGIIFHDQLSEDFCGHWANAHVSFHHIDWHTPWTAAEERVRIYRDWIRDNPCDKVMTTDLSDVEFYRDPFELLTDPAMLYIGSERRLIGEQPWMLQRMMETYGEAPYQDRLILNPGICGGSRARMLTFLDQWLDEMDRAIKPTPPPHDICAFIRLIYREKIPFVTGHPLHTAFGKKQWAWRGAAIRHK
jgi:hypothetical protein